MSARSYFEQRTAIPGYTFILLVMAINSSPLFEFLGKFTAESQIAFGSILGFLALLGGSAIGHLVSQYWWWRFQESGEQFVDDFRPAIGFLIEKYDLVDPERIDTERRHNVLAVWGYVIHLVMGRDEMKELVRFTTRRWDLYHSHSSVMNSLTWGAAIGFLLRFLLVFDYYCLHLLPFSPAPKVMETVFVTFIVVACVWLHTFFRRGREHVAESYCRVSRAIIEGSGITSDHLREVFPENYFDELSLFQEPEDRHE